MWPGTYRSLHESWWDDMCNTLSAVGYKAEAGIS